MADEHFNAPPHRGCPVCLRQRSLVLSRDGSGLLDCGDATPLRSIRDLDGCGARFRVDGQTLVRVPAPDLEIRTLTSDEMERVVGGAPRPPKVEQYNAGARLADSYHCPSCGARGFRYVCPRCASDMGAG
ncbi:MAG TPA: hypothetical protein VLH12_08430 [Usitatibacter sp.]|nr:hypothetical protein [Usitatibacter sp.]